MDQSSRPQIERPTSTYRLNYASDGEQMYKYLSEVVDSKQMELCIIFDLVGSYVDLLAKIRDLFIVSNVYSRMQAEHDSQGR